MPRPPSFPWLCLLLLFWGWAIAPAQAGPLADRAAAFPQWQSRPPVQPAQGDLSYPHWFGGTWTLTSTLEAAIAPLAPQIVTPGFAGNQALVGQRVECPMRFVVPPQGQYPGGAQGQVVSDRAFNGYQLATAYLGADQVKAVKVDPNNPNRQLTRLRGDRTLESTVLARAVEQPSPAIFITSEIFQQVFRGIPQPYLNEVENTTLYTHHPDDPTRPITADQITAIYLSPQDPQYDFSRRDQPVALYRYRLTFAPQGSPVSPGDNPQGD